MNMLGSVLTMLFVLGSNAAAGGTINVSVDEPGIAGLMIAAGIIGVIAVVRRRKKK